MFKDGNSCDAIRFDAIDPVQQIVQPVGFYSPSQLAQDARHHRIDVRPVDVGNSAIGGAA